MNKSIVFIGLLVAFALEGCAADGTRHPTMFNTIQQPQEVKSPPEACVQMNYEASGNISLRVHCPGQVVHIVNNLKPETDYEVLIGENLTLVRRSSSAGILVFKNPKGENVQLLPKTSHKTEMEGQQ